ncbi:hypothetical protein T439DRAFT_216282 [Meredithblackwellia eburnea MCA 4105]
MQPNSNDQRDKLSKAMGAAFLAHQVSQLERSVDKLSFSRDPRLANGPLVARRGGAASGAGGLNRKEIRVLDASALVHALPLVKRWIREDTFHLVVPLDVFSTLDILKRASGPLHELAREATRFLEVQLDIARRISQDKTFVPKNPRDMDPRVRLRAQQKGEELSWAEVESKFRVPADWPTPPPLPPRGPGEESDDNPEIEEDSYVPTPQDIPRTLRSTLQCALYFSQLSSPPSIAIHETVSFDPTPLIIASTTRRQASHKDQTTTSEATHHSGSLTPVSGNKQERQDIDFDILASGSSLAYFSSTFFPAPSSSKSDASSQSVTVSGFNSAESPVAVINFYRIPSTEILAAKDWAKALAAARAGDSEAQGSRNVSGNGGKSRGGDGKGRGGRGGGSRGDDGRRGGGNPRGGRGGSGGKWLFVP